MHVKALSVQSGRLHRLQIKYHTVQLLFTIRIGLIRPDCSLPGRIHIAAMNLELWWANRDNKDL